MIHWKLDVSDNLARLSLKTDKKGNRLSPEVFIELNEVLLGLDLTQVRGLVLSAEGSDFSQGFDLSFLLASQQGELSSVHKVFSICNEALDRLYNLPIPTISFVKGSCIGGGFLMVLATDFRVAHNGAMFGFPEVKQSLVVNLGLKRVYDLLGEYKTKELVLLGDPVSSKKLMDWGAVNWLTEDVCFEEHLQKFQSYVSNVPPLAVKYNKELIQDLSSLSKVEASSLENELQLRIFQSSDFKEAIESFLEKRAPFYKGE